MKNLLLVDDNISLLKILEKDFSRFYNVKAFSTGKEAISYIESHTEDLYILVCDFKLTRFKGTDILKRAKELKPDTIRILLTGYTDEASVENCEKAYDAMIDKNVCKNSEEIFQYIEQIEREKNK